MSIHTRSTPTMPGAHRRFGPKILVAALGGVAVLVAAVGAGVWARSDSREAVSPAVEASAIQPSLSTAMAAASGSYAPNTIYVVDSPEQAEAVWATINSVNAFLAGFNQPPFRASVLVVASGTEAVLTMAYLTSANAIRYELGQPQDPVIDLRGN